MNVKTIVVVAVFSAISATSYAQAAPTTASKVSAIKNDKARIKQGVQSGQLTNAEAIRLAAQTKKLQEQKKEMKADSVVTTEERKEFRKDKKQLSRRIYKQKHDGQVR
jgi:ribosomal protein S2